MTIAVLIPAYNADLYLRECLDSVLAAGAQLDAQEGVVSTLDIFACDDGSTDTTRVILMEYSIRHANVHMLEQENRGVVATRNRLLDELPPEYDAFAFVDSDDLVAPDIYVRLVEAMERTGADIAECGMPGNALAGERTIDDMSLYLLRRTAPGPWINVVNKLYRRTAVGAIRFREGLRFEEDFFFNYEIHAQIRRKVILPEVFYTYRDNPESATHALDFSRYFESTTRRIRLSLEVFLAPGRIPKALEGEWRAELSRDAYRMCIRKNLKKNPDQALLRKLFFAAGKFLDALECDFCFGLVGLNPLQRLVAYCCRCGYFRLARMLSWAC